MVYTLKPLWTWKTEARLHFKHSLMWRPRPPRDLLLSVTLESCTSTEIPSEILPQLSTQVLWLLGLAFSCQAPTFEKENRVLAFADSCLSWWCCRGSTDFIEVLVKSWGCYGSWSPPYMLLLKVFEHVVLFLLFKSTLYWLRHSMCWSQWLLITFSVFLSIPGSESPGNKPDLARNVSNTSCSKLPGGLSSLCAVISIILPCNTTCKQRSWPPSVNDSPWSFSSGRRWWKRIKAVRVTFLPKKIVFTPCSADGVSPGGQAYSAEGADFHFSWCCGW